MSRQAKYNKKSKKRIAKIKCKRMTIRIMMIIMVMDGYNNYQEPIEQVDLRKHSGREEKFVRKNLLKAKEKSTNNNPNDYEEDEVKCSQ